MLRGTGRAFVFIRWSGHGHAPARLGDVAWAIENIDRQGHFYCYHCGSTEIISQPAAPIRSRFWTEKCFTLPELIKAMSAQNFERPGYDEVKVFDVPDAEPDAALLVVQRLTEDTRSVSDPLDDTREILTRYGVRGMVSSKGFSAPFLWYNILPGRSVPVRKLAVHLFTLRAAVEDQPASSPEDVEHQARKAAQTVSEVRSVGECFVYRVRSSFLVAMNIAVNASFSVGDGRRVADHIDVAVRAVNPRIERVFVQIQPDETPSDSF